jgi:hypothetical protein
MTEKCIACIREGVITPADIYNKRTKLCYSHYARLIHPKRAWAKQTLSDHRLVWKRQGIKKSPSLTQGTLADYVKNINNCQVCGVSLDWTRGTKGGTANINSPSLDRKDPNDNYVSLDNIQILCTSCNKSKANLSKEEWIAHSKKLNERFKEDEPELYDSVFDWHEYPPFHMQMYDTERFKRELKRYGVTDDDFE